MATKKAMSKQTEYVYNRIKGSVEYARERSYDEWLGKCRDSAALRELYEETRQGIIYDCYDGRSLAALERRGLIKYFDNMEKDCWEIYLIEQ